MDQKLNPNDAPLYDELRLYCIELTDSVTEGEDILQDVYIRWWMKARDLQGRHLKNWLYRTARHRLIDKFRVKHPDLFAPDLDGASEFDAPDSKSVNPADEAERREKIKLVLYYLKKCDDTTREIVRLRFYEDCTYEEIGMRVGMAPAAVRNIILRTLEEILKIFQRMDGVD